MIGNPLVYPAFATLAGAAFLLLVPKHHYKRFLLWGFVFGGIGDTLTVILLSSLNLIRYKGMGVFGVFNLFSVWTPLAWMFAFSIFFFLLPVRKAFLVPYILGWAALNYGTGLVLESMGLFEFIGIHRWLAVPTFILWYSVSAWAYYRSERIELR